MYAVGFAYCHAISAVAPTGCIEHIIFVTVSPKGITIAGPVVVARSAVEEPTVSVKAGRGSNTVALLPFPMWIWNGEFDDCVIAPRTVGAGFEECGISKKLETVSFVVVEFVNALCACAGVVILPSVPIVEVEVPPKYAILKFEVSVVEAFGWMMSVGKESVHVRFVERS